MLATGQLQVLSDEGFEGGVGVGEDVGDEERPSGADSEAGQPCLLIAIRTSCLLEALLLEFS